VLGLNINANAADVRSVRHHLSRATHPDKTRLPRGAHGPDTRPAYSLMCKACDTLLDGAALARYESDMAAAQAAAACAADAMREAAAPDVGAYWLAQERRMMELQDEKEGKGLWRLVGCVCSFGRHL
jgi:hypothetical protein